MKRRLSNHGTTLVQIMVAMALASMVLKCVTTDFVSTWKLMAWVAVRSDVGTSTLQGLNMLSRELRAASYESVTIIPSPPSVAFRVQDPANLGVSSYAPGPCFILYTFDSTTQTLVRKLWTSGSGPTLMPDPLARLGRMLPEQVLEVVTQVVTPPLPTDRIQARGVEAFAMTPATFPTLTPISAIHVTLTVRRYVNNDPTRPVEETVTTAITCRNHS